MKKLLKVLTTKNQYGFSPVLVLTLVGFFLFVLLLKISFFKDIAKTIPQTPQTSNQTQEVAVESADDDALYEEPDEDDEDEVDDLEYVDIN